MFTAKTLKAGQEYAKIALKNSDRVLVLMATTRCYAVADECGNVVFSKHPVAEKYNAQIFDRKYIAQQQADYMNRKEATDYKTHPVN